MLQSIRLLADAVQSLADNCVAGIEANAKRIETHLRESLMLVTALNPHIDYDKAAEVAKKIHAGNTTLKEAATSLSFVTEKEFDEWVNPEDMIASR